MNICIPYCVCCQEMVDSVVHYTGLIFFSPRKWIYVLCGHFERVKYFYIGKGMLFMLR